MRSLLGRALLAGHPNADQGKQRHSVQRRGALAVFDHRWSDLCVAAHHGSGKPIKFLGHALVEMLYFVIALDRRNVGIGINPHIGALAFGFRIVRSHLHIHAHLGFFGVVVEYLL